MLMEMGNNQDYPCIFFLKADSRNWLTDAGKNVSWAGLMLERIPYFCNREET